jgi:hypothetical protein
MPKGSTNLDLVSLTRRPYEAADAGDLDAILSYFRADAVYDMGRMGLSTLNYADIDEGRAAAERLAEERE